MSEQAALADPELTGEAADREALEPLLRGDLDRPVEDRLPRLLAAGAAPVYCRFFERCRSGQRLDEHFLGLPLDVPLIVPGLIPHERSC